MSCQRRSVWSLLVCLSVAMLPAGLSAVETFEDELLDQPIATIAARARVLGDPIRGYQLFHRSGLSCVQCHPTNGGEELLGPDLSRMQQRSSYAHVIQSVLRPDAVVTEGFQSATLLLDSGQVVRGIVRGETDDALRLAIPGQTKLQAIAKEEVEERLTGKSLMPGGLVNQLSDESQFYDLVAYVVGLGSGSSSVDHVDVSQQNTAADAPIPLPEYESDLNHALLIRQWDDDSFQRGKVVYQSLCINCHGDHQQPGSLPNALRFASGVFANGGDPYSMYRTLTHGFRMMMPQRQLVPREKYDVIHYIREAYLRPHNESQYSRVDEAYLHSLPKGGRTGPNAEQRQPWREMDYGPFLINTYEVTGPDTGPRPGITREERQRAAEQNRPPQEVWPDSTNFAYKGIAIRLDTGDGGVSAGRQFVVFDHDTMRVAGAWTGDGFIDWRGILFNGNHAVTPRTVGQLHFGNLPAPGWAHPINGTLDDPRLRGKDGRAYGPMPKDWVRYRGLYRHPERIVVSYQVGDTNVLESHDAKTVSDVVMWQRILNVGPTATELLMRVAPTDQVDVTVHPQLDLIDVRGDWFVRVPVSEKPLRFVVNITKKGGMPTDPSIAQPNDVIDLSEFTDGGSPKEPERWTTKIETGNRDLAFSVDTLTRPLANRYRSRLRLSGLDFVDEDTLVVCCWDGDVWTVRGITNGNGSVQWRRIATGLFQPLGIKLIGDRIYVACRDQIVILNDLNDDGETDFYECFNCDHQVTDHFHEFAMGLQCDDQGNLYYAKSARHARDSLVPQHGTLLKVSADGESTEILANGFRAANGVCLNDDGSFFVTDQEGHWNPMNRINRVEPGKFYGNMYSYGAPDDSSDDAMEPPLCWPNKMFDRSPAELLWVDSPKWGKLNGSLLSLSYGYGKIFLVPHEQVGTVWQGGMCELPIDRFPTGIMRGRFHAADGQLYVCGLHAWASDQSEQKGGLYRVCATDRPAHLPIGLAAHRDGITLTFTDPVDPAVAKDPRQYMVDTWTLKRTSNYGSRLYDEQSLEIDEIQISDDGRRVTLGLPDIQPTWCMQISYKLADAQGVRFLGTVQNTVHALSKQDPPMR
ncbi:DUF6797 domain-containing protein [Crateriforma spongiae]|uniref:DUF6797 domain-containing protein n=1 Tax=Crateriforma spongiae TaxID=2724528 RepID=UPI001F3E5397|nr:DUF6797 domain-containing protein [Crateriforma spongiae]